jgi:hypothetical protein
MQLPLDIAALWSAWGTPDFNRVLQAELQMHRHAIPLEKACDLGGIPDDAGFRNFRSETADPGMLRIRFEAIFRERVSPGCGGSQAEQTRYAEFTIHLTREACRIEFHAPSSEPEF